MRRGGVSGWDRKKDARQKRKGKVGTKEEEEHNVVKSNKAEQSKRI